MPYDRFICPDGEETPISQCMKCCRCKGRIDPQTGQLYCPGDRCLSRRTLCAIAKQRPWTGEPSTTQLLKGTREMYLELTHTFAINPMDSLFALHGTNVHANLEQATPDGAKTEMRLDDGVSTGAFDFFDESESGKPDTGYLYDDKTYGSFKVAKVLGIYTIDVPTGEFYKSGNKKGQEKTRKVIKYDGPKDRMDLAIQLNDYRMKIEKCLHKHVEKMMCEIIVRDGNTFMANNRGVTKPGYLVEVNKISDRWVSRYMSHKAKALEKALQERKLPPPCNYRERWGDRKCKGFCNVAPWCDYAKGLLK